jgi:hypothetical protein
MRLPSHLLPVLLRRPALIYPSVSSSVQPYYAFLPVTKDWSFVLIAVACFSLTLNLKAHAFPGQPHVYEQLPRASVGYVNRLSTAKLSDYQIRGSTRESR